MLRVKSSVPDVSPFFIYFSYYLLRRHTTVLETIVVRCFCHILCLYIIVLLSIQLVLFRFRVTKVASVGLQMILARYVFTCGIIIAYNVLVFWIRRHSVHVAVDVWHSVCSILFFRWQYFGKLTCAEIVPVPCRVRKFAKSDYIRRPVCVSVRLSTWRNSAPTR